jgi:hypothetical protein
MFEEAVRRALDEITVAEPGREHFGAPASRRISWRSRSGRLDAELARELEIGGEGVG